MSTDDFRPPDVIGDVRDEPEEPAPAAPVLRPILPLPPHTRWFRGDEPAYPQQCSVCQDIILDEEGPPLLCFKPDGSAMLIFCRQCQATYWGMLAPRAGDDEELDEL